MGADFCVFYKHEKVVDIWGGYQDPSTNIKWQPHTLVPVFSTTKAVSAVCLAILNSRDCFSYTDKVCSYWPEFAQNGKENITIKQLLQHRAGLSAIDYKLTPEIIKNPEKLNKILAKQKPYWEPGSQQGYHVWTIGWYMSALVSRIDPKGRRIGEFVKQEINNKLDTEFYIGIDDDFDINRVAKLVSFSKLSALSKMPFEFLKELFKPWSVTFKSMFNPGFVKKHTNFNKKKILKLEMGSGNGVGNAQNLATIMDGLIDDDSPLRLKDETIFTLMSYPEPPPLGYKDKIFKKDAFRFHCGFMKPSKDHCFAYNKKSFGGFGAGGSFVMVDPVNNLTMAYTMNKMSPKIKNEPRAVKLRNSVYKSLKSD